MFSNFYIFLKIKLSLLWTKHGPATMRRITRWAKTRKTLAGHFILNDIRVLTIQYKELLEKLIIERICTNSKYVN